MAKKQYFLIIDTETTQTQKVADFGAIICDKEGNIFNQCAVLVDGIFTDKENHPLFFDSNLSSDALWSRQGADRRYIVYNDMVKNGSRMVASLQAVNNWLAKAAAQYQPILTAYNLAFDRDKCCKTGIDLTLFNESFCLWQAAHGRFSFTKKYLNFILENHAFNSPTKHGNMTFQTNAEVMARFVLGQPDLENEPHTALEDVLFYELPILKAVLKRRSIKRVIEGCLPYNWKATQVKNHFRVK